MLGKLIRVNGKLWLHCCDVDCLYCCLCVKFDAGLGLRQSIVVGDVNGVAGGGDNCAHSNIWTVSVCGTLGNDAPPVVNHVVLLR